MLQLLWLPRPKAEHPDRRLCRWLRSRQRGAPQDRGPWQRALQGEEGTAAGGQSRHAGLRCLLDAPIASLLICGEHIMAKVSVPCQGIMAKVSVPCQGKC